MSMLWAVAIGLVLAVAGGAAAEIATAAPPDPARLAELRTEAADWNRCRVFTANRTHEFTRLSVDSLGVLRSPVPRRAAIVVSRTLRPEEPKRISWAEIERIEGARSHAIKGMAEGAIVGGILGASAGFLILMNEPGENFGAVGFLPLGLLLGGFTGSTMANRTKWTPLYP